MKKVCVVTAARSEYGLLRWVIDGAYHDSELELQLVVAGAHLSVEHGETWKDIAEDGYPITTKVDIGLKSDTKEAVVESMGRCSMGFAKVFTELMPDIVVVLGDRYELLPICSAALVMNIPIAHISGGDVTIGAIDNEVRNAITMMSTLHFPGVEESAQNIIRMRGCADNVWAVGEPGLDNFNKMDLWNRQQLAENLKVNPKYKWILVTLHSETQESLEYNLRMAENVITLCDKIQDAAIIITKANADFGSTQINEYWDKVAKANPQKYSIYPSLGQYRYLSFMKECFAVIGNSSSGIVEAPALGTPVINIGNRQRGRYLCSNVHQVDNDLNAILNSWNTIISKQECIVDNYYGDGHAAERIVNEIKKYLLKL